VQTATGAIGSPTVYAPGTTGQVIARRDYFTG